MNTLATAMNISYLEIRLKSSIFRLSYLLHNSADCVRELFKPSKDLGSLRVCNEKILGGVWASFFVSDVISKVGFWPCWLILPGLGPNCQMQVFH